MAYNKGSLKLLAAYETDSDDEDEVPGCRVSVKRTFREDSPDNEKTTKHLKASDINVLPPPSGILSMFPSQSDIPVDNPDEHNGRKRVFPHQRGNWVTLVYIRADLSSWLLSWADDILSSCQEIKFHLNGDTHISLTRTVILLHHWIEPFISSIQDAMKTFRRSSVTLGKLRAYCNEDCSRTFIGFEISSGSEQLSRISKALDFCLSEFKLPPFYEEESFHVSIAWCVGDQREILQDYLPKWQSSLQLLIHSNPEEFVIPVTEVICDSGNKKFNFPLS